MAQVLLERVERQHAARNFGGNDVRMDTYNDLIQQGAELFMNDPVLNGQMTKMPDSTLQSFGPVFPISSMPPELPHQRLEERLTRFIARMQYKLGEEIGLNPKGKEGTVVNPVVKNAADLIDLMLKTGGETYPAQWLVNQSELSPKEIEAAVALLERQGAIQVVCSMGDQYGFDQVFMEANAQYVAHELRREAMPAGTAAVSQTIINAVNVNLAQNASGQITQTIHASSADKDAVLQLIETLKAVLLQQPDSDRLAV